MSNYDKINYIANSEVTVYDVFWKNNHIFIVADSANLTAKVDNNQVELKQIADGCWTFVYIYEACKNENKIAIDIFHKKNYVGNIVLTDHKLSEKNQNNFIYTSTMFSNDVSEYIINAWIQHNLYIGVNRIFLYYNSCDTHKYSLMDLGKESLFIPWIFPITNKYGSNVKHHVPQQQASMMHCLYKYCKNDCVWMMSLDLDELLLPINCKTIKKSIENISKDIEYIPMKGHSAYAQSNIESLSPAKYHKKVSYDILKKTKILSKFPSNRKYLHKCSKTQSLGIHDKISPSTDPENQNYFDDNITFLHLTNFSRFVGRIHEDPCILNCDVNTNWNHLYDIQ